MTAWTIYWILQLDSIAGTIELFAWIGLIFGLISLAISLPLSDVRESEAADKATYFGKRILAVGVACSLAAAFIPTTKTAAAMFVIPAIVNNETLKAEAGDLYQLAKQALREAVTDKPEPKK